MPEGFCKRCHENACSYRRVSRAQETAIEADNNTGHRDLLMIDGDYDGEF